MFSVRASKAKKACFSEFADDRMLTVISTKVEYKVRTQSYLDRYLVKTRRTKLNRLKNLFEQEQKLIFTWFCKSTLIFENLTQMSYFLFLKITITFESRVNERGK